MNFDHYITKINTSNRPLFKSFTESINSEHLERLNSTSIKTYFVAMTPRSGSSYFVDLLKKTNLLGNPDEYFNPGLIDNTPAKQKSNNLVDYWLNLTQKNSHQDMFGLKISFFQFSPFLDTGLDKLFFKDNKIILLKRKNIVKQAISLYLATESTIFHTNTEHSEEKWNNLKSVEYNNEKIKNWIKHIEKQERGWDYYLKNKNFLPLYYEDIINDPEYCIKKSLEFLQPEHPRYDISTDSVFEKIGSERNIGFYNKFLSIKNNSSFLQELNIDINLLTNNTSEYGTFDNIHSKKNTPCQTKKNK